MLGTPKSEPVRLLLLLDLSAAACIQGLGIQGFRGLGVWGVLGLGSKVWGLGFQGLVGLGFRGLGV